MGASEDKTVELEKRIAELEKTLSGLKNQPNPQPIQPSVVTSPITSQQYNGPHPLAFVGLIVGGLITLFSLPSMFSLFGPYGYSRGMDVLVWPIIGVAILGFSIKSITKHRETESIKVGNENVTESGISPSAMAALNLKPVDNNDSLRQDQSTEFKIASNWFAIVGIVAIILGAVFFLKFAFDNGLIGPVGQVSIGVMFGLAFLVAGEFLRSKYPKYSFIISGGGVVVLYLSMWASYGIFHLTDQVVTLGAMSIVTVLSTLLAIRYQALPIAILGLVGGFLTPLMLAKGFDNQMLLMSYVVILDLGVLGIAIFKNWLQLNVLALAGTYIVFLGWFGAYYTKAQFMPTMIFLTIIFLIFALVMFIYNVVNGKKTVESDAIAMGVNAFVYFALSYSIIKPLYPEFLGFCAFFMALLYFVLGYIAFLKFQKDDVLTLSFLGISILFLTIAVPLQVKKNLITIIWAIEASVLLYAGFWLSSYKLRVVALAVYLLVGLRLLAFDTNIPLSEFTLFINRRFVTFGIAAISLGAAAYLYSKFKKIVTDDERNVLAALVIALNIVLVWAISWESLSYFNLKIDQVRGKIQSTIPTVVLAERVVTSSILIPAGVSNSGSCDHDVFVEIVVGYDTTCNSAIRTIHRFTFRNIDIPNGVLINKATLNLNTYSASTNKFVLKISGDDYQTQGQESIVSGDAASLANIDVTALVQDVSTRYAFTAHMLTISIEDLSSEGYALIKTEDSLKVPTVTISYEEGIPSQATTSATNNYLNTQNSVTNKRTQVNNVPGNVPLKYASDSKEIVTLKSMRDVSLSIIWGVYSILLIIVGIITKYKPIRLAALAFFAITIFKVFLIDSRYLQQGYRIIAFMVLGGILLSVSLLYQKYKDKIGELLTQ